MSPTRFVLALMVVLLPASGNAQHVVRGKAVLSLPGAVDRNAMRAASYPRESDWVVAMPALAATPKAIEGADDKRLRVGVARDVTQEATAASARTPAWFATADGGRATHLRVTSAGALALRVALALRGLPRGAELRVSALDGTPVTSPLDAATIEASAKLQGVFWTPVTEGDTQLIELWLPAGAAGEPSIAVESVSHLVAAPSHLFKSTGPGSAQACEENVVCVASVNPALARAANAVAKLLYTENGVTYLCSGTLVSDGDASSQVPYLLSAAHCIDSDAAAATLNTFWFYQASSCNGKDAATYKQLTGGAALLFSDATTDVALVRLRDRPPEGAWFAGWDATPLAAGAPIVALHHPSGDVKKVSLGQALDPVGTAPGSYSTAAWTSGSTEPGSSGSGLFTFDGHEFVLRGALRGGSASCGNSGQLADPANRDYFSRLDIAGATLAKWLSAPLSPLDDYGGLWFDPAEPGWGLSIVQSADNHVFATWFTYDAQARATWLVMPQAAWQSGVAFEGALYRTGGSDYAAPYDASRFTLSVAGSLRVEFAADGTATATFAVDGNTLVKPLVRQPL
ncbi:MAG TPA: serine protease [Usitatibacter sp.]|jgi:hypothetical protein|nr:serine protease [Usitatibacter sp.]